MPTGATVHSAPVPLQQAGGNQANCCTLVGIVTDATGAIVPNVKITITSLARKRALHLKTDETGQFIAKDLPAGKYDVTAMAKGFKTKVIKGVEVNDGTPARLNIELEFAPIQY
jgi:hypothetical protein